MSEVPRKPVLSIGEFLIDLIAADGSRDLEQVNAFSVQPGGAPANAAVALARLGMPSAFCGVVGEDPFGRRLLHVLDHEGVDRSRVRQTHDLPTSLAFAWKDARGDGHFQLLRLADSLLTIADIKNAGIGEVGAIVIGTVSMSAEPSRAAVSFAAREAARLRVPVCVDLNVRPTVWPDRAAGQTACRELLESAMMVKMSLTDAEFVADISDSVDPIAAIFESFHAFPARYMVVTDGERGAWFANREGADFAAPQHVPAFQIQAVEPTGAGDAFTAAVISRLIRGGWTGLTCGDVQYASAAGALTATKPGAIASLPTGAEIDSFLNSMVDL